MISFKWAHCNAEKYSGFIRKEEGEIDVGWQQGLPLAAKMGKNLPAMQEMWVWSLGQEDPMEKEVAAHSSILAWEIPWPEEPDGLQSLGSQRAGHDLVTK